MANMTFLDANVLLEILLDCHYNGVARQFLAENKGDLCISALTAHLICHFGLEIVDMSILLQFLADYTILNLSGVDFEWVFTNSRNLDFEDSLQLAIAIRNGCDEFVTFDKDLHKTYKDMPIINIRLLR